MVPAARRLLALLLGLTLTACAPSPGPSPPPLVLPADLQPGATWTLTFPPTAPREVLLDLRPGWYLDLALHQRGVDVVSRLAGPGGAELRVVDTATGARSSEEIRLVVPTGGSHRLRLDPAAHPRGSVELEIRAYRPADAADRRRAEADASLARGHLAWIADDLPATEAAFRHALPILEELREPARVVESRHILGLALEGQGRLTSAATELERAVDGYRRLHRTADEALTLNQLGRVLRPLGRPLAAEAAYRRALSLARRAEAPSVAAAALQNLGLVAQQLGSLEEALDLYEEALELRRRVGPPVETALVLQRLGSLYSLIGRDADGLVLLTEARELADRHGNPRRRARALDALAWARHHAGQPEQALSDYAAALDLAAAVDDPGLTIDLVSRRASVLRRLGRHAAARRDYRRVLEHRRSSGETTGEGYARTNLGWVDLEAGDLEAARTHLHAAVELLEGRDLGEGWYYAHLGLGRLERQAGQPAAARRHLDIAIATVEGMRGPLASWLSRGYLLGSRFAAYEELIGLLMDLHRAEPAARHDLRALEVAERARVRSLVEDLSADQGPAAGAAPTELAAIRRLEMERLDLQRTDPDHPRLPELDEELRRLWLQAERSPQLRAPDASAVRILQAGGMQKLLDDETRFLVFSLGEPESFLWVIGRTAIRSFRLPDREQLSTLATHTVLALASSADSLGQRRSERRTAALSKALLAPAADELRGQRLVVVPDGALHLVPFAALPLPRATEIALLDRFEVVTVPSPSVLALQRDRSGAPPGARGAAILADPVYKSEDPRLDGHAGDPMPLPRDLQRSAADLDLVTLDRLEHTAAEAEAILSRLPADSGLLATDFAARPEVVTRGDLSRYPILHFAAHGLLHPVHPELSGIVLSLVDEEGQLRDGFLRAHEVARQHLPAELVVLSACRTALGHEVRGEAPLGLTQAFFRAGSRRVLASLWSVDDRGTAALMERFYAALLDQGLAPGAALRQAQLDLRHGGQWSAPYYWAAFHLQGEWRGDLSQP